MRAPRDHGPAKGIRGGAVSHMSWTSSGGEVVGFVDEVAQGAFGRV